MDSKPLLSEAVLWEDAPELAVHRRSEFELDTFGGTKGLLRLLFSFVLFCVGSAVAVKVSLDARDARRASRAALSPTTLSANLSGLGARAATAQATNTKSTIAPAISAVPELAERQEGGGTEGEGGKAEAANTEAPGAVPALETQATGAAASSAAVTPQAARPARADTSPESAIEARAKPEPAPVPALATESSVPASERETRARTAESDDSASAQRRPQKSGALDRQKLASSLAQAAHAAKACAGEGTTRVLVTFAPLGYVRSVDFEIPPAPREARSCVLAAFTRARIPPFSGEPVTARKTFSF